jgi:uncharacterized protein (DUF58 family)
MDRHLGDAELVRELDALARHFAIRARSGMGGDLLAKRRGGASEFQEHRGYSDGDDLRRIDWAAYARTDEPVVKVFRSEEDAITRVVCDASASLDFGTPRKIDVARRISAAIGYLALSRSGRAQLFASGEGIKSSQGPSQRASRGRGGLGSLLRSVDAIEAAGATNLARAVDDVTRRSKRPGLLALVSDFLDPGPVTSALGRAASAGHDIALVRVVAPEEASPVFEGDVTLEDAETGETIDVTMDAFAIEAYCARLADLEDGLRAFARRRRASYVRARTDDTLLSVIRRFVARSID